MFALSGCSSNEIEFRDTTHQKLYPCSCTHKRVCSCASLHTPTCDSGPQSSLSVQPMSSGLQDNIAEKKQEEVVDFGTGDVGYKIFDVNTRGEMQCRDREYKVGETAVYPHRNVQLCFRGFHYCKRPMNCLEFFDDPLDERVRRYRFARVRAYDNIIHSECGSKSVTNRLLVEQELSKSEFADLCTGWTRDSSGGFMHHHKGVLASFEDKPCVVSLSGSEQWRNTQGQKHRSSDLPADIARAGGYTAMSWYSNDVMHRDSGPAFVCVEWELHKIRFEWKQKGCAHHLFGASTVTLYKSYGVSYEGFALTGVSLHASDWRYHARMDLDGVDPEEASKSIPGFFDYKAFAKKLQAAPYDQFREIVMTLLKSWGYTDEPYKPDVDF